VAAQKHTVVKSTAINLSSHNARDIQYESAASTLSHFSSLVSTNQGQLKTRPTHS